MYKQVLQMLRKDSIGKFVAIIFIGALLAACGGGGSTSSTGVTPGTNNPPPAPGTRNVSLNWTAPASRTNGNPVSLSEIGGYKLYVGSVPGDYNPAIDVGNTTSHTLQSMNPGTYYLALSAYDTNAQESALSTEFPVTIN